MVDPIECGGGLLDYTEHEYQKVRIIEDWGHLGGWLSYPSNYCLIMSLGSKQNEKFVVFSWILWVLVRPKGLVLSYGIWGLASWEAFSLSLPPTLTLQAHTTMGALIHLCKNAAGDHEVLSHLWYLDSNLTEHCEISPDAARMPLVLWHFW